MDELAKRRAEKTQDCREWSVEDALEDCLNRVKAGEINPSELIIHYFEKQNDGSRTHGYTCAGLDFMQHIALLHVAMKNVMQMWTK